MTDQLMNPTNHMLYDGLFGLEIEEHRVNRNSHSLSQHPHPTTLGDRRTQPYFQTDFSESQEEVVTAPKPSSKEALQHLHELQRMLSDELADDEIIWPLSMPPHLTSSDIKFLQTHFERSWYQQYRNKLFERYGNYQHILTGVHVNFSPSEDLIQFFAKQHPKLPYATAKNYLFFQIVQQVANYRWLITYLFGASPLTENSNDDISTHYDNWHPVRSWRSSHHGFANLPEINVDYTNFETYIQQIQQYIQNGDFYDQSEFYGPVRLKGADNLSDIVKNGAAYIEFRMFDIDPFTQDGISQTALSFLHLLIIDAIINPNQWPHIDGGAANFNHVVATQTPSETLPEFAQVFAQTLFLRLEKIVAHAPETQKSDFQKALSFAKSAVTTPDKTLAAKLATFINNRSLVDFALKQGKVLSSERRQESIDEIFASIPEQLRNTYIQAHKLGFKTMLDLKSTSLHLTYGDRTWTVTQPVDLSEYI
ncbi:glutamate--cysteine ligase [Leuconostoc carnosum]|uniref:Glutamate--cysteine ligase n=2 Tax=Leuconostoc carnosum TaxID=1252 RepID=K0DC64_LEUCJ|nr:glutamate--cysteine ligase [Leuconostoc carnosum]AFT82450.1 gamma-glutamylcysteine synthetase [Leuconostoc carnosum JB16]KAA8327125.1 glutamate--cysteine ligase [Leuconostoc carnosum]QEA33531.1 glutamate--cysteine ligase [Leuconostoc carnosum]